MENSGFLTTAQLCQSVRNIRPLQKLLVFWQSENSLDHQDLSIQINCSSTKILSERLADISAFMGTIDVIALASSLEVLLKAFGASIDFFVLTPCPTLAGSLRLHF